MRELADLAVFDSPGIPRTDPAAWRLTVEGLVERPLALDLSAIRALPAAEVSGEFRCREGWVVPDNRWRGVRLNALLAEARLTGPARFLVVEAGAYTVCLPLATVRGAPAILAYERNGAPLPREHGGPLRLVAPACSDCFASVKWVERLEATDAPRAGTAEGIALGRLRGTPEVQPVSVRARYIGVVGDWVGARRLSFQGSIVRDVVEATLAGSWRAAREMTGPDGRLSRFIEILVNGQNVRHLQGLATPLAEDDEVTFFLHNNLWEVPFL